MFSWKNFIQRKCYKFYEKLALRHLNIERDNEIMTKMENFIKVVY